jgi:hypothetical protein
VRREEAEAIDRERRIVLLTTITIFFYFSFVFSRPPGEPASSTPLLPEITGPFEVEVTVRWDDLTKRSWQTALEYSNADDTNANAIWFGQGTSTIAGRRFLG